MRPTRRRRRFERRRGGLGLLAFALVFATLGGLTVAFKDRLFPPPGTTAPTPSPVSVPPVVTTPPAVPAVDRETAARSGAVSPAVEIEPEPERAEVPAPEPKPEQPAPGVRDGVTGENLGTDPLDRMENPQGVTIPESVVGLKRTNAAYYWAGWMEEWREASMQRQSWRQLAEVSGGFAGLLDRAEEARAAYLLHAVAAEERRAGFYRETGRKVPTREEVARASTEAANTGGLIVRVGTSDGSEPPADTVGEYQPNGGGPAVTGKLGPPHPMLGGDPAITFRLPRGKGTVTVRAPGYEPASKDVEIGGGMGLAVSVMLTKRK